MTADAESLGNQTDRQDGPPVYARERIRESIAQLDSQPDGELGSQLTRAVSVLLSATDALLGECQMATPFAALRPVITQSGELRWCCSHPTQHCVSGA